MFRWGWRGWWGNGATGSGSIIYVLIDHLHSSHFNLTNNFLDTIFCTCAETCRRRGKRHWWSIWVYGGWSIGENTTEDGSWYLLLGPVLGLFNINIECTRYLLGYLTTSVPANHLGIHMHQTSLDWLLIIEHRCRELTFLWWGTRGDVDGWEKVLNITDWSVRKPWTANRNNNKSYWDGNGLRPVCPSARPDVRISTLISTQNPQGIKPPSKIQRSINTSRSMFVKIWECCPRSIWRRMPSPCHQKNPSAFRGDPRPQAAYKLLLVQMQASTIFTRTTYIHGINMPASISYYGRPPISPVQDCTMYTTYLYLRAVIRHLHLGAYEKREPASRNCNRRLYDNNDSRFDDRYLL